MSFLSPNKYVKRPTPGCNKHYWNCSATQMPLSVLLSYIYILVLPSKPCYFNRLLLICIERNRGSKGMIMKERLQIYRTTWCVIEAYSIGVRYVCDKDLPRPQLWLVVHEKCHSPSHPLTLATETIFHMTATNVL